MTVERLANGIESLDVHTVKSDKTAVNPDRVTVNSDNNTLDQGTLKMDKKVQRKQAKALQIVKKDYNVQVFVCISIFQLKISM